MALSRRTMHGVFDVLQPSTVEEYCPPEFLSISGLIHLLLTKTIKTTGTAMREILLTMVSERGGAQFLSGFSIHRKETAAGRRANIEAMVAVVCESENSRLEKTMKGQCHKYQPYERSPTHTNGFHSRRLNRLSDRDSLVPTTNTTAVTNTTVMLGILHLGIPSSVDAATSRMTKTPTD